MYKTLGANVSIVVSVLQIEEHHYKGAAQAHTNSRTKVLAEERASVADQNKQSLCLWMRNAVSFVKVLWLC